MYDVVVIGAGSAGAVVAARASEHPDLSVLLLEAGPDYPLVAETPFDLVNSHDNSYVAHDWGFSYTPMAGGRPTPFPRGRVTGGSSSVNTAIALRGMPEDYDHWASLGNSEWAWSSVLPAFCRLERDLDFGSAPWHGDAGPITIRRYRDDEMTEPQAAFLETASVLGYPSCPDANDPSSWGAGPHPMNKAGRVRVSTAIGYLAPARVRPNLEIRSSSPVARLVVEGGRVVAAEVESLDGGFERIEGRLFVLSAGAIASPALLLRSGVTARGVGENLADHPASLIVGTLRDGIVLDTDGPLMQTILRYTCEGSSLRNDLQIEQLSFLGGARGRPVGLGIAAVVEATFSRGSVRLGGDGSSVVIDANLCADERDVDRLARSFLDALRFFQTKPLSDLIEEVTFPRLPVDLETARDLVRRYCGSGYHPCGTLRMGPDDDPVAVVDQYGRARVVDGLVVADASIMPTVPRANTNLTCIMIGEMIGEWLRVSPGRYGL